MKRIILLDTGPLGKIVNVGKFPEVKQWLRQLLDGGAQVLVPEISDYELRRGLLRLNDLTGISHLDDLHGLLGYLPLTTAVMRQAAQFWAEARRRGYSTAAEPALDGDAILAAQAATIGGDTVIATENVGHLGRYTTAFPWHQIV